jgi:NAD(P)H-hydrate epimerase
VLDIGILPQAVQQAGIKHRLMDDELMREWHKTRPADSHKGTYGHVLLAGGSKGMSGAIALATTGAVEIGAGLCTAFIPGAITCAFNRSTLESMSVPYGTERTHHLNATSAEVMAAYLEGKNTAAIGPGLGLTDETREFLPAILAKLPDHFPLVLDADALNILAEQPELWKHLGPKTVLTPHPGEMARLMGLQTPEVQQHRLELALELAKRRSVVVVLKGAGTLVTSPDGSAYICAAGNPGMATGGAGDVLTGAIAGLLAQGYKPIRAAAMGVYLHATTGDRLEQLYGQEGVTALKLARNLGRTLREMLTGERPERW